MAFLAPTVASRRQTVSGDEAVALAAREAELQFPEEAWIEAILGHLAPRLHQLNRESFQIGRNAWQQ